MKRLFIALALITASAPIVAQEYDDWYEVELILFENLDPTALDSERWPEAPGSPEMEELIELTPLTLKAEESPPTADEIAAPQQEVESETETSIIETPAPEEESADTAEQPFQLLPKELYQLTEQYEKLEKSDAYRPLVHVAWRQIIRSRTHPDRIHIYSGMDIPKEVMEESDETLAAEAGAMEPTGEMSSAMMSQPPPSPPQQWRLDEQGNVINIPIAGLFSPETEEEALNEVEESPRLDGVLTLSRGRYIHLQTDLLWRLEEETADEILEETVTPEENLYALPLPFETAEEMSLSGAPLPLMEEEEPVIEMLRVQGKLRTRSGEIHYIDHPAIGMLVLFTPYAPAMEEEETADGAETFAIEH